MRERKKVLNGIDRIGQYRKLLGGKRVGLITNPTGVDRLMRSTIDIVHQEFNLSALYSPEHGVRGDMQAGAKVASYQDKRTGVPVYSLYGEQRHLTLDTLAGVDILVFDIQDIGSRYYTYLYTLAYAMMDCGKCGLPIVVLDRVNPLGGEIVEGNLLEEPYSSFVGLYPIPVRYGLTIGEFAGMIRGEFGVNCSLEVIGLEGWHRGLYYDDTDLLWVSPSPNMPAVETALLYNGTCLLEGTNVSEGRGTTKPFEILGAPWIDGYELAAAMNHKGLEGVLFRPASFIPSFSKHRNDLCGGVQIHVTDKTKVRAFEMGLALLDTLHALYPDDFSFLSPQPEEGRHFIDLLSGTDSIRKQIGSAAWQQEDFLHQRKGFENKKARYHLY